MNIIKNDRCLICKKSTKTVFKIKPTPLADLYTNQISTKEELYSLNFNLCENCGLFQLNNIIDPKDIYNNHYLYRTFTSIDLEKHFLYEANKMISKYNLNSSSFVVDIGSNSGLLLTGYKQHNIKVLGIEPVKHIADEAIKNNINTLNTFFDEIIAQHIAKKYQKADIIHANNVLANIQNLHSFMKGVKILLNENGFFIMETSYLPDLIDGMVFDTFYHEHISYFSLNSLEYLMGLHNLKIVDVEKINTKGGSIRCYVAIDKGQEVSNNVLKLKNEEIEKSLFLKNSYEKYQHKIETLKNELIILLNDLKTQGYKIVGYGASNTTTTLMYHFELYNYIDYIVDDNNIKIGRFCPGNHIPVLSPKKIYEDGIEYIFIFAWRFSDIIIKKHKKFLENGGSFIIPLPQISIITSE